MINIEVIALKVSFADLDTYSSLTWISMVFTCDFNLRLKGMHRQSNF